MLLTNATLADGSVRDVEVVDGRITAVDEAGRPAPNGDGAVHDLDGYVLLPAPAEPHAHLDKALTATRVFNPTGDLDGAVAAWLEHRRDLPVADLADRARRAALIGVAHGATAIRTHVDVGPGLELRAIAAVAQVKRELAHLVDIQIVALVTPPLAGTAGADNRARLRAALELGADLVGGAPYIDDDPIGNLDTCLLLAAEYGAPIDLHTDETIDVSVLSVRDLAAAVSQGFEYGATASHCVSLGVQPREIAERVADELAEAGVAVVTLPQTNLFLQAREAECAPPRGLTAIRPLLDAGVVLAGGGDNLRDPFNSVGRGDPLETASLLVAAGHLDVETAYRAISAGARTAMGLEPVEVAPGFPADLLAVRAPSLLDAVAGASEDRFVFRAGRLVARTESRTTYAPA